MFKRTLVATLALVLTGIPVGASADRATTTRENWDVVQKLFVDYNLTSCKDTERIQLTAVTFQYRKHVRNRAVSVTHLRAIQNGRKCDGYSFHDSPREETYHPVFGCGGRCGARRTEAMGFVVDYPYVLTNGEPPFVHIAAAVHGHLTTRSGRKLGNVCTTWYRVGGSGCGDL